jgi:hypothetical protein
LKLCSCLCCLLIQYLGGHKDVVAALLAAGANASAQNKQGCTPLHYAAAEALPAIVRLLLQAGSNVAITNHQGKTAADVCAADDGTRQALFSRGVPPATQHHMLAQQQQQQQQQLGDIRSSFSSMQRAPQTQQQQQHLFGAGDSYLSTLVPATAAPPRDNSATNLVGQPLHTQQQHLMHQQQLYQQQLQQYQQQQQQQQQQQHYHQQQQQFQMQSQSSSASAPNQLQQQYHQQQQPVAHQPSYLTSTSHVQTRQPPLASTVAPSFQLQQVTAWSTFSPPPPLKQAYPHFQQYQASYNR